MASTGLENTTINNRNLHKETRIEHSQTLTMDAFRSFEILKGFTKNIYVFV